MTIKRLVNKEILKDPAMCLSISTTIHQQAPDYYKITTRIQLRIFISARF